MRNRPPLALPALLMILLLSPLAQLHAEPPETALCHVCRVHEGEAHPEPVEASATFEGETYHFCSVECRDEFLVDPLAYVPPVFPRPLPAFEVESLDGSAVASKAFEGRVTLLDFWATWCPPCLTAMPKLDALHARLAERGFQVVGISIDEGSEGEKKARKMVEKRGLDYPLYFDTQETPAWAALHVRSVPAMFLVDAQGSIVAQWSGHVDLDEVTERVEALLPPAEAR